MKGKGIIKQIKGNKKKAIPMQGGPTLKNLEDFFIKMSKKADEPKVYYIDFSTLMSMPDDMFSGIFLSDNYKCITSTAGVNKINWRAYKLKLINEYKPI